MAANVYRVIVTRTVEESFDVVATSRDAAKIKVAIEQGPKLGVIGVDWKFALVSSKPNKEAK